MSTLARDIVDIHSHLYPRWYIDELKGRNEIPLVRGEEGDERFVIFADEDADEATGGRAMTDDFWSLETKLRFMARHGITRTVLSLGNPWLDPFDATTSLDLARRLNDDFATLGERTDGRIIGMGALPGKGLDAILTVLDEVAGTPGLVGLVSGTRIGGHLLDDSALDPVWHSLERTGLVVLLHPHHGSAMDELQGYGHALPVALGFPLETTVAVARMAFAGVPVRFPKARIVVSHAGGAIPYLAGRLDAGWRSDPSLAGRSPVPPSGGLAGLYLDAIGYHSRTLSAAADLVGVERLAFGTDHPFSVADPAANLEAIHAAFAASGDRVLAGTARALFDS